jgi:hypothetical protein
LHPSGEGINGIYFLIYNTIMTFFILSAFPLAGVHTNKEKSYQVSYLNVSTVENGIFAA